MLSRNSFRVITYFPIMNILGTKTFLFSFDNFLIFHFQDQTRLFLDTHGSSDLIIAEISILFILLICITKKDYISGLQSRQISSLAYINLISLTQTYIISKYNISFKNNVHTKCKQFSCHIRCLGVSCFVFLVIIFFKFTCSIMIPLKPPSITDLQLPGASLA